MLVRIERRRNLPTAVEAAHVAHVLHRKVEELGMRCVYTGTSEHNNFFGAKYFVAVVEVECDSESVKLLSELAKAEDSYFVEKPNLVLDFADDRDVGLRVQEVLKGAKNGDEVRRRLHGCVIIPEPGKLFSVEKRGEGFDVLFLIGKGQRPRVIRCSEKDFDDFS